MSVSWCSRPHAAQRRVIDDQHLEAAALDLHDPSRLAALRWPSYDGEASAGHYVQVLTGEHTGRFATVTRVNQRGECAVELEDKKQVAWVRVKSSGMKKAPFLAEYGDEARSQKVREAIAALPIEMKDALNTVRERVAQDRLPLFSHTPQPAGGGNRGPACASARRPPPAVVSIAPARRPPRSSPPC